MNEIIESANAQPVEHSENAVVAAAARKPVILLLTTGTTRGRWIRHWVVAAVTDLESGVLYAPLVSTAEQAVDCAMELVNFSRLHADPRVLLRAAVTEEADAFVITYDMTDTDEVYLPLVWRERPVRVVTMDSTVPSDARTVLCRYRGRMSKELRVYRGDLNGGVI